MKKALHKHATEAGLLVDYLCLINKKTDFYQASQAKELVEAAVGVKVRAIQDRKHKAG